MLGALRIIMITHVGIIDQDPVRLITPLLDEAVPADKMIFIGTEKQQQQYDVWKAACK